MITVFLPAVLRHFAGGAETLTITAPVCSVAELIVALERTAPFLTRHLHHQRFTFAVNGETRPDAESQALRPGDHVAIVPAEAM